MGYRRGLRARISESDGTFVVAALLTVVVWMLGHWTDTAWWGALGMALLTTYILLETNTQCQLLRIRSRMVSSTFLLLISTQMAMHSQWSLLLPACALVLCNLLLFRCYEQRRATGSLFYAYLFLGIACCQFPPVWLMVPVLWFCCAHYLRNMSLRGWRASILGLLLPHLYYILAMLYSGAWDFQHWTAFLQWPTPDSIPPVDRLVNIGVMVLLFFWSIVHFSTNSFRDNTRTRMFYNTLQGELLLSLLLLIIWPPHSLQTLTLTLVAGTPFAAHYFSLSEGRWHDFWIGLWVLLLIALPFI